MLSSAIKIMKAQNQIMEAAKVQNLTWSLYKVKEVNQLMLRADRDNMNKDRWSFKMGKKVLI